MKFDSNLVWKQATVTVAANRDLVLALAGVFFFLPSFALIMLAKQPQVPPGSTPEQVMAVLQPFAAAMAPWFLLGSVAQALGMTTLIELFAKGGQSTVGQALRRGLYALPYYIVVQLLLGMAMALVAVFASAIGGIISPILGGMLAAYLVCQAYGRFIAAGAMIVLEDLNPFAAIVRAVKLSRGNGFRLGNFLFLLAIAAFFLLMVMTLVIGILAALAIGEGRPAELFSGFFSSAATAVVMAYFVAIIVAIYRQLTGNSPEQSRLPLD